MTTKFRVQNIFLGVLAGLASALICLLLAYLVGVVVTGFSTRELFATLLAAATVLPIVLALVVGPPTLVIGFLTGLTSGILANFTRRLIMPCAALIGFVSAEVVISVLLPLVVVPHEGDFTSIITSHYSSGLYGLILGTITGLFCRQLANKDTSGKETSIYLDELIGSFICAIYKRAA